MECIRRIQNLLGFHRVEATNDADPSVICYSVAVESCTAEAKIRQNIEFLANSIVPDTWIFDRNTTVVPRSITGNIRHMNKTYNDYRDFISSNYSMWALVDKQWTQELSEKMVLLGIKRSLEVGGGKGWLSNALLEHSVQVTCTDIDPPAFAKGVECLDGISAVLKYGNEIDALIISWPNENSASDCIRVCPVGTWIIYIGQSAGKFNADKHFFKHFKLHEALEIPTWDSISDTCLIGKKVDCSDDFDSEGMLKESLRVELPNKVSDYW